MKERINFEQFLQQERERVSKPVFSKTAFVQIMCAYMNDPKFESHEMKVEGDTAIKQVTQPVMKFRKFVEKALVDLAGMDKKDAETVSQGYQFKTKDIEGLYEFFTDLQYQYLRTGRSLNLFSKEDVVASIQLREFEEETKRCQIKTSKIEVDKDVRYKKHKKLKVKSSTPVWMKEDLDDSGAVKKAMKQVVKGL